MRLNGVFLLIVLAIPSASALSISGELVAGPKIDFPADTALGLQPFAIFLRGTEPNELSTFTITAPRATFMSWGERSVVANATPYAPGIPELRLTGLQHSETWTATNVTIKTSQARQPHTRDGTIGITPFRGAITRVRASSPFTMTMHEEGEIGNDPGHADPPDSTRTYERADTSPFAEITVPGIVSVDGASIVKIVGPVVEIHSDQNDTTIETGVHDDDSPGATLGSITWLIVNIPDGHLVLDASAPVTIGAETAQLEWRGAAAFAGAEGELQSSRGHVTLPNGATRIEGDFAGALSASTRDNKPAAIIVLRGDLDDELASTLTPRAFTPLNVMIGAALVLALAALIGTTFRRARQLRLALSLDELDATTGHNEDAPWIFAEAAVGLGKEDAAAESLILALERNPMRALDVEHVFPSLARRDDVARAIGDAQRRAKLI